MSEVKQQKPPLKAPERHNTTQGSTTQRHACGGLQPHTQAPRGHNTTQSSTTQRHACGGLQPHTTQSTPRAQHYTKQHDTTPCLRRAPATHRTKHPEGHNTTTNQHDTTPRLRRAPATHRTKHPEGHITYSKAARHNAMLAAGSATHRTKRPRGTTLHKAARHAAGAGRAQATRRPRPRGHLHCAASMSFVVFFCRVSKLHERSQATKATPQSSGKRMAQPGNHHPVKGHTASPTTWFV
jgi:hypothetical protein